MLKMLKENIVPKVNIEFNFSLFDLDYTKLCMHK